MADPIMDLFDDPNLFGLDPLTDETFAPAPSHDPIEEALTLAGALDPPPPPPESSLPPPDPPLPPANPPDPPQLPPERELLSQGNPFMGVSAALPPTPSSSGGPQPPKIVILKAPQGAGPAAAPPQAPAIPAAGSGATPNGGKVTFAKVLTPPAPQLRPGVSIVAGNAAVLTGKVGQGGAGGVAGTAPAVHRLVQPGRPVKQLVLQPVKAGGAGTPLKPAVTLTSAPAQGESKRITLVLQQPAGGAAPPGQRHVVLGSLPGKLLLQGSQLAALGQAKGPPGQPAKVVTIQLQVQQPPPGAGQSGAPQKIQLLQSAGGAAGSGQSVTAVPQVVGGGAGGGQRVTVPLKVVLQPQAGSSQGASPGLSVVKVLSSTEVAALAAPGSRGPSEESRKLDHQKKQEKANRIVAEAIARARARGEQNIPRVLNEDELPSVRPEDDGDRKRRRKGAGERGAAKEERVRKGKGQGGKSKGRSKPSTITPVVGKKRKRNASSDNSDAEVMPAQSPREEEETSVQKRRSNRQVKRKKYTEDLDIKITDDEEDEELDVTGPIRPEQPPIPQPPAPEPEPEGETLPSMQFFVENPSEEDAAIVDKVLSMRVVKKELPSGQLTESEEFFVKYKNYSYLHCEWATIDQLEKDKRIHQKLKRFKTKMTQMRHFFHEDEEPFNPDYVEVDRILDESHSVDKDNGEPVVYYLVKWCSLPYEDSTWELKEDVDEGKIAEFKRIQARHPELKRLPRPQAGSWKKLELSHEYKNHNQLREYQLEGVNWLLFNWYNRQNCILADEMGLGKTIQSIAFLQEVYNVGIRGPFLVIAPLSTITNWEREFNTWTEMNSIVYHGSLASRQMIQQYEMYCKDARGRLIPGAYKFDALITTFEMILSDCPELREIEWRCVVIDEAHRLKNRNCKLLDSLKHMDLEHKVLLTGTPLQNTVEELFSLLHFLEPSQFPSEAEFLKDFGDLKTEEQVQKLQAILKPMMLRRLKEDVEKNLAPKQETIIEVELTNIQKKYYRAILEKNFSFLSKGAGHTNMPNLLNTMMELRKCCNHPYLINGAEEKILAEFRESCHHHVPHDFHLQAMVRSAGKLVLIDKLLPKLKAGGHKVLIFSQMVRCLDILEDYLIQKRYLYERIDGRVRGNLRQAAIDRFSKPDSDRFVFLLCTRAGGLGINLTAADTCIIFDSDWNPQNDLQAQARCHRIGQSKAVKVYRLITRNSYEREMFDKASLKLGLDKAVLQSMSGREGNIAGIQQFSKKEIEDLLRKGAYAAIMEEDDEGSKFCEEDIDQILLRRTTTITIESEGKGSTFAKASFVASENRTDIALDDPNFWQKWAKKADLDLDLLNSKNNLVIDTPRVRKQTRHFSTLRDDDLVEFSDLESEDEERPRARRHDRHHHGFHHAYGRTDCFRVEKHLLVYGWGRWREILSHGRFKRRLAERDVETICRAILVYCLLHYRGDENIKSFIWDLITPTENGKTKELQNHSGLSIPVPRGRKGKKVKSQSTFDVHKADWIRKYNPETLFQDESYKKHLKHQCNKVLLRVRMLYYLRQEVIGDRAEKVLAGAAASDIDIWFPLVEQLEGPTAWWDAEADKSLLLGVFKHGYEKYNTMRADPALCFLEKAGRPDDTAIAAEQRPDGGEGVDFDKDCEDPEYKPLPGTTKEVDDEADPLMLLDEEISVVDGEEGPPPQPGQPPWPAASVLTARFRRLITASQRSGRRPAPRGEGGAGGDRGERRRRRCEAACKLKEMARREKQQRWTRREQADFYRVASSFGVEFDPEGGRFRWGRFRALAGLEKKTDENLTKFFHGFVAMCRQVCRLPPAPGDGPPDPPFPPPPYGVQGLELPELTVDGGAVRGRPPPVTIDVPMAALSPGGLLGPAQLTTIDQSELSSQLGLSLGGGDGGGGGAGGPGGAPALPAAPPSVPSPEEQLSPTPSPTGSLQEEEAEEFRRPAGPAPPRAPPAGDAPRRGKPPKKPRKKKDPNEPQKPVSAYALFFRDTQAAIKGQNPSATFGEVSKIVASMWDSLGEEQKQVYKRKTEAAKKEYLKALAAYRAVQTSTEPPPPPNITKILISKQILPPSLTVPSPGGVVTVIPATVVTARGSGGVTPLQLGPGTPRQIVTRSVLQAAAAQLPRLQPPPLQQMPPPQPPSQQVTVLQPPPPLQAMQQPPPAPKTRPQQPPPLQIKILPPPPLQIQALHLPPEEIGATPPQNSTTPPPQSAPGAASPEAVEMIAGDVVPEVESPTPMAVGELVAESPAPPRCVRAGCENPPVASGDWDEEYCSSECVVRHCRDVFLAWLAARNAGNSVVFVK
ncbi:LOW QUALITY PROTEIN: chromodomain-helicase-DNA-binding protein 8 [Rhynochetos jubatus]